MTFFIFFTNIFFLPQIFLQQVIAKEKNKFFFYSIFFFVYFNLCNYFILSASYYQAPLKLIQGYATQALATTPVTESTTLESTLKMNIIYGNHVYYMISRDMVHYIM